MVHRRLTCKKCNEYTMHKVDGRLLPKKDLERIPVLLGFRELMLATCMKCRGTTSYPMSIIRKSPRK